MPIVQLQSEFIAPPEYTWAARPAPGSPGRVIRVSDIGPAPGIEMVDSGTRWRPVGGRQVLAQRSNNPVTVQSLSSVVAETIGPFPGGLVRAGMRLEMDTEIDYSGYSISARVAQGQINGSPWWHSQASDSGAALGGRKGAALNVQSDANAAHPRWASNSSTYTFGAVTSSITVNFSAPWSVTINLTSAAETAVNISSATWAGGIATLNTSAPHTLAVGDKTVIAGVTPSGWNIPDGAIVLSVPTSTQFTVALAADPGTYTSGGTSSRISNMISQSYVLELVG